MGKKSMKPATPDERDAHWLKTAQEALLGRKITKVEYMTREDADANGFYHRPVVFTLDNGVFVFPMADEEGNDCGALAVGARDMLVRLP